MAIIKDLQTKKNGDLFWRTNHRQNKYECIFREKRGLKEKRGFHPALDEIHTLNQT